jgi:hypothetical protein
MIANIKLINDVTEKSWDDLKPLETIYVKHLQYQ